MTISRLVEEGERQAEIQRRERKEKHRRYLEREALKRRTKAREDSRQDLHKIIREWDEIKRIQEFFSTKPRLRLRFCCVMTAKGRR